MNVISATSWSWRALRGHSVTFAGLFGSAVLGVSILSGFHHLLSRVGAPWYVLLLAPFFAVGWLAKKEQQWIPDAARRRRLARTVFWGSVALAFVIAWLRPSPPAVPAAAPAAHGFAESR